MPFKKCGRMLAATLVLTAPAYAEDAEDEKQPMEITITTPLKRDDPVAARRVSSSDTASLLIDQPGVSLNTGGGVSSLPALHGLADDRIRQLVDGMPITSACANHMNPALSYAAPGNVAGIGVTDGLAPVSMGGDSIAGTISVNSPGTVFAEPGKTLASASLSAYYRSVSRGTALTARAALANNQISLGYTGSQDQASSYKDGRGNLVRDTLYKSVNQQLTLATRRDGDVLQIRAGVQSIPYQGFANQYMDMTGNRGNSLNADYRASRDWGKLEVQLYWQDARHAMGFFTPEKAGTMPMNTHGKDVGYAVKAELPLSQQNTLRIGQEFHGFRLDDWWPAVAGSAMMSPNAYVNINNGRRDVLGLYGEMESNWDRQWSSVLGVRADSVRMDTGKVQGYGCGMMCAADTTAAAAFNGANHARHDNHFDLSAVARYEADPSSSFEFGFARKTRSPNLYERYSWGRSQMAMNMVGWFGDANGYVGNLNLKPEVAHTLGATARWHDNDTQEMMLTAYYTRVSNYIGVNRLSTYVSGGSSFAGLQFANHDARIYGLDFSGRAGLWDNRYGTGALKAAAGWTRGTRLDTGGSLYHIMPFHARLTLQHILGEWVNALELQYVAGKNKVDVLRNEPATSGYALLNLRTAYVMKSVRFDFGIDNLFNRYYFLPLGGVDYADWKANGRTGQIAPLVGAERSINAGLTVKF